MREIKFRAWKKSDTPEMYYNLNFIDWNNGVVGFPYKIGSETFRNDEEPLANLILQQYTGLKDKNGVEIYEGDIGWDDHQECYGVVKFDEGKFVYAWENVCEALWEVQSDIEVVGNIHENSELLEGK